jgi:D-alanine-D-alanine ligase
MMEQMNIPCSGASSTVILLTSIKPIMKKLLLADDIPTPRWAPVEGVRPEPGFGPPWILKPLCNDGSTGIYPEQVCCSRDELNRACSVLADGSMKDYFIEHFIEGREFAVSLLGRLDNTDPQVLPPAEIVFVDYPPGKPKIVDYTAKWETGSFEYQHTPTRFLSPQEDGTLFSLLTDTALRCWKALDLDGYARVDMRLDSDGNVMVLEANANPCLSPDAGFVAAAIAGGLGSYREIIERIVACTYPPGGVV